MYFECILSILMGIPPPPASLDMRAPSVGYNTQTSTQSESSPSETGTSSWISFIAAPQPKCGSRDPLLLPQASPLRGLPSVCRGRSPTALGSEEALTEQPTFEPSHFSSKALCRLVEGLGAGWASHGRSSAVLGFRVADSTWIHARQV